MYDSTVVHVELLDQIKIKLEPFRPEHVTLIRRVKTENGLDSYPAFFFYKVRTSHLYI